MAITTIGFLPGTDFGDLNSNWTPFSGDIVPHSQEPDGFLGLHTIPTSQDGAPRSTGLNPLSEVLELNSVWHFKRISGDILPHSQEPDGSLGLHPIPTSQELTGAPRSTELNSLSEVIEPNSNWHFKRIP
jgi:hypothetical protein